MKMQSITTSESESALLRHLHETKKNWMRKKLAIDEFEHNTNNKTWRVPVKGTSWWSIPSLDWNHRIQQQQQNEYPF